MSRHKKALIKTLSWKILSTIAIFAVLLALGVDTAFAGEIALIDFGVRAVLYYIHELYWHKREAEGA